MIAFLLVAIPISSGQTGTDGLSDLREAFRKLQAEVVALRQELATVKMEVAELRKGQQSASAPAGPSAEWIVGRWVPELDGHKIENAQRGFGPDKSYTLYTLGGDIKGTYELDLKLRLLTIRYKDGGGQSYIVEVFSKDTIVLTEIGQKEFLEGNKVWRLTRVQK
jgi:hypothetical protein